jgi:hypothetical protein
METHKIAYEVILRETDFDELLRTLPLMSRVMDCFREAQMRRFIHEWNQGSEKRWRDETIQRGPSHSRHEQVVVDDSILMRYRITVVIYARPAHMDYIIRHLEDTSYHLVRERIKLSHADARFFEHIDGDSFPPILAASRESSLKRRLN